MSDPTTILYQMGEAVAAKVSLGKLELLQGDNTWTGTNAFDSSVSVSGSTTLHSLSVLRAATFADNLTVEGDLTVTGTTTALSTSTLEVDDNFIHISKGASAGAYNKDSGLYFERGQGSSATAIVWDESEDRFVVGSLGSLGDTLEVTLNGKKRTDDSDTSTFVATFTLSGQLADDVNSIQITGVSGGPTATDYNGTVSPWTFSAGVLTYTFDSDDSSDGGTTYPQPSFIQFQEDVKKLGYDATNGYYVLATADSTIFDVNFADPNYADYDFTIDYSLGSTPVEILATSPDADTADVTPGPLRVGSLSITDQDDGELTLGDLSDFEAGLAASQDADGDGIVDLQDYFQTLPERTETEAQLDGATRDDTSVPETGDIIEVYGNFSNQNIPQEYYVFTYTETVNVSSAPAIKSEVTYEGASAYNHTIRALVGGVDLNNTYVHLAGSGFTSGYEQNKSLNYFDITSVGNTLRIVFAVPVNRFSINTGGTSPEFLISGTDVTLRLNSTTTYQQLIDALGATNSSDADIAFLPTVIAGSASQVIGMDSFQNTSSANYDVITVANLSSFTSSEIQGTIAATPSLSGIIEHVAHPDETNEGLNFIQPQDRMAKTMTGGTLSSTIVGYKGNGTRSVGTVYNDMILDTRYRGTEWSIIVP